MERPLGTRPCLWPAGSPEIGIVSERTNFLVSQAMDDRCVLCDQAVTAIAATVVVGDIRSPDVGALCRRCAEISAEERHGLRDQAMARMLAEAVEHGGPRRIVERDGGSGGSRSRGIADVNRVLCVDQGHASRREWPARLPRGDARSRDPSTLRAGRAAWMHAADRHAVLVVDDYEPLRDALVMQLRCGGHAVRAAASGRAALAALAEGYRPCVILLDLWMPEMDGLQVCEAIKADPRTASIPVVMLSGDTRVVARESAGVAGVLAKPADKSELVATIAAHARCA